jgi:hypothetical protein
MRELEQTRAATIREAQLMAAWRWGGRPMAETPDKVAALTDAVRILDSLSIGHALIGGIAVGIHSGRPRATLDVDLAFSSSADRQTVIQSFEQAGFRLVGEFPHSINFRHASGEPVQLAFDPAFDVMLERAERFEVTGVSVPIVSKEDLIAMKERAAADPARRHSKRLLDQADVALLRGDVPDPDEGW